MLVGELGILAVLAVDAVSAAPGFERAHGFLKGLLEGASDAHGFADGFHLSGKGVVRGREFFESEARDLGDHIVDGRFEAGGRFAGDVVHDLVEGVSDGEFCGELGDRESGCLGGEGGGAGDAGVHLNDDHASVFGIERPLDVGTAGFDTDCAHDGEGGVAHPLVFAVGEGLRGSYGDAVAGMHAHGVDILDGADDDRVVLAVAHDFEFKLFPSEERFFDEDFGVHAGGETAGDDFLEFLFIVSDSSACSAECESGADDERVFADLRRNDARFLHGVSGAADGKFETDALHGLLEELAVFCAADDVGFRADHFDFVSGEDSGVVEFEREVERGLSSECGENRVGAFASDDFVENVFGKRFDISAVREIGIGHDSGGIAVDEDDFISFLFE